MKKANGVLKRIKLIEEMERIKRGEISTLWCENDGRRRNAENRLWFIISFRQSLSKKNLIHKINLIFKLDSSSRLKFIKFPLYSVAFFSKFLALPIVQTETVTLEKGKEHGHDWTLKKHVSVDFNSTCWINYRHIKFFRQGPEYPLRSCPEKQTLSFHLKAKKNFLIQKSMIQKNSKMFK